MPTPKKGETHEGWKTRCMGDEEQRKSFPERDQRFAVCENLWKKHMKSDSADPPAVRVRADGVAELTLYGEIGGNAFDGLTAKALRDELRKVKAKTLNLRIDSMGGSVFEGNAMLSALDEFPGRIEVDVDGVAASMASVIMTVGHVVRVARNGFVMVHNPYTSGTAGGPDELRRVADLLDKMTGQVLDRYAKKAGGKTSRDDLAKMMSLETWFTAPEAVAAGLADSVSGTIRAAACADPKAVAARFGYQHVPDALADRNATAWAETERRRQLAASL